MHKWKHIRTELPTHDEPVIAAILDEHKNWRHFIAVFLDGKQESSFDWNASDSEIIPEGWYAVDMYTSTITEELYKPPFLWREFPFIRSSDEYKMITARRRENL